MLLIPFATASLNNYFMILPIGSIVNGKYVGRIRLVNYHQQIAKNIKKYCKRYGLTFSELARRSDIPISTIQGLLYKSRKEPRLSTVHSIAKALNVSIDKLVK
jgi:predicted transcriptional regulator